MEDNAIAVKTPELRLVAFDPAQLQDSQKQLILWCNAKIDEVAKERDELEENLRIAKESKWNTARPKAALRHAEGRIKFYEKIHDALEAGFYIVPNFPCDIFAIRTEYGAPSTGIRRLEIGSYKQEWIPALETSELPAVGEGDYVGPLPEHHNEHRKFTNEKNETKYENQLVVTGWTGVDFPFVLAKPKVLTATQQAMALRIFDEMGVCPQTRKSDPLVVGIIKGPKKNGNQKQVTFLVTWFLDTNVL